MKIEVRDPSLPARLLAGLGRGGVAVMPCDTIYGLVGVAPDAEQKIRALKGRQEKSFLLLIPSADWLGQFSEMPLPGELARFWPGPLTVIFPARKGETVALRVPDDTLLRRIMQELGKPLFSTSANRSGEPSLWRIADITSAFAGKVDLIVDAGDLPDRAPSTILDVTARPFKVLREGALRLPEEILG